MLSPANPDTHCPYDDPHVSAGEIADYLDQLRPQSIPSPPTAAATPSK